MLGDSSSLSVDDVGFPDVVQQGGLAVVNVSHDRDDGWARAHVCRVVLLDLDRFLDFCTDKVNTVTELLGDDANGFLVQSLVDGDHHAQRHASRNHFVDGNVHQRCEFGSCHKLGQLECVICLHFGQFLPFGTFRAGIPLGPACLGAGLGFLALAQTSEGILDFFLDVLVGDLFSRGASYGASSFFSGLFSSGFHIDFRDALALSFLASCGGFLLDWKVNLADHSRP